MHIMPNKILRRGVLLACLGIGLWACPAGAATIDFEDASPGTNISDQYLAQGVSFSAGVITTLGSSNRVLQVADTAHPQMNLNFSVPIYHFSAKLFEIQIPAPAPAPEPAPDPAPVPEGPSDNQPPDSGSNPADAPPADESKPSVYPTLHFTDGTSSDLTVIHALGEWKDLSFQSVKPVSSVSLLGHYFDGQQPIYFVVDNMSFDSAVVTPEPASAGLFLSGLLCLWRARRRST